MGRVSERGQTSDTNEVVYDYVPQRSSPTLADLPLLDDGVAIRAKHVDAAMLVRARARVVRRDPQQRADRVAAKVERRAVGRGHLAALLLEVGDAQLRVEREAAVPALLFANHHPR